MDKGPRARSCCQPRWEFQEAWPRMTGGSRAQVCFLQRRFHKDILLNPVLVLSFCPDLSSKPGHLGTATRELLFLLDALISSAFVKSISFLSFIEPIFA